MSYQFIVVCHQVILATTSDETLPLASRRACYLALDALEGDPSFLERVCDCRAKLAKLREAQRVITLASKTTGPKNATSAEEDAPGAEDSRDSDIEAEFYNPASEDDNEADLDAAAVESALDAEEEDGDSQLQTD